jgi:hypothetical protein
LLDKSNSWARIKSLFSFQRSSAPTRRPALKQPGQPIESPGQSQALFFAPRFSRLSPTEPKRLSLSKNPANISEDRVRVKRFFRPPPLFSSPDARGRLRRPADPKARHRRPARPAPIRGFEKNAGDSGRPPLREGPPRNASNASERTGRSRTKIQIRKRPERERLLQDRTPTVKPFFQAAEIFFAPAGRTAPGLPFIWGKPPARRRRRPAQPKNSRPAGAAFWERNSGQWPRENGEKAESRT